MKQALVKTWKNYQKAFPIMFGMFLLINLFSPFLDVLYGRIFTGNLVLDPFLGAVLGSVAAGIPVTAYVIGGELMAKGVSLLAVSAFTLTWTTVWLAFLPMEIAALGKRFALFRNLINFFFAIIIAILAVLISRVLS